VLFNTSSRRISSARSLKKVSAAVDTRRIASASSFARVMRACPAPSASEFRIVSRLPPAKSGRQFGNYDVDTFSLVPKRRSKDSAARFRD
jgi:hypothetical protein